MYVPKYAEARDPELPLELMERHSFATLVTQSFASHLPILVERNGDRPPTLWGHLAKSNPHYRLLAEGRETLAIFQGPNAYVSPSLYVEELNVPTWNYSAVHALCVPEVFEDAERIDAILRKTVEFFEKDRARPWRYELPSEFKGRLIGAIAGFKLTIRSMESKFKLSQNRDEPDYWAVLAAFEESRDPSEKAVAALMKRMKRTQNSAPSG